MNQRFAFALIALLAVVPVMGGSGVLGVAVSQGQLQVNNTQVDGNANLSSGAVVTTSSFPSRLHMANGSNVILDQNSEAKVLGDRVILQRGVSQFSSKNSYEMEALGFRVAPESNSQVRVQTESTKVVIAALNGPVRIADRSGMVVARLAAGRALSFEPGAANGQSTMTGRLAKANGKFVLPDEVTGLTVELTGNGLDREVGKRVQVTGNARPSADRATQVVEVAKLNRVAEDASPSPAPSPNPTPQSGGVSNGAKVAIVIASLAGVGVAAGVLATQSR